MGLREDIGLKISQLREERGLSQKELSEELSKIGLPIRRETVTQWENGTRDLKTEYLAKLSEYFCISPAWLLGLSNDPQVAPTAVDELGISMRAVEQLKLLNKMSKVPPENKQCSRIELISSLLESADFDRFLAFCARYVMLLRIDTSLEYSESPEYKAISDRLIEHGYVIAVADEQADLLFSERIINTLRLCLEKVSMTSTQVSDAPDKE